MRIDRITTRDCSDLSQEQGGNLLDRFQQQMSKVRNVEETEPPSEEEAGDEGMTPEQYVAQFFVSKFIEEMLYGDPEESGIPTIEPFI